MVSDPHIPQIPCTKPAKDMHQQRDASPPLCEHPALTRIPQKADGCGKGGVDCQSTSSLTVSPQEHIEDHVLFQSSVSPVDGRSSNAHQASLPTGSQPTRQATCAKQTTFSISTISTTRSDRREPSAELSLTSPMLSHQSAEPLDSFDKTSPSNQSQPPSVPIPAPPTHPLLDCRYKIGPKLGHGCFATVYKATRLCDGVTVAIKVVEKNRLDKETATLLDNELQILRAVSQHPGIVTLLDNIDTNTHMFFVMDYVDGGPLLDRIVSRGSFSENDARILLRTILLTLQFLSQLGCVHRDIKPENILVDNYSRTWSVKLTDFGLSAKMQPDKLLYAALGTPLFVAPEILKRQGYDCSCDMWSLGVVLYIVLCGYPPFPFEPSADLIGAIVNGRYSFPAGEWDHVSQDAKDVVRRMLEVDPMKRITPGEALEHRWVAQSQSTCDLPNRKLKSFNARRKLKASMFAVRTTNDLINSVKRMTLIPKRSEQQQQLLRDVEENRAIIKRLGIGYADKSEDVLHGRNGESGDGKVIVSQGSKRSLVLPVNVVGTRAAEDVTGSFALSRNRTCSSRIAEICPLASQCMESKAKAMVAQVNQSRVLVDSANPFMNADDPDSDNMSYKDDRRNEHNGQNSGGRPTLASLDFGLIGL